MSATTTPIGSIRDDIIDTIDWRFNKTYSKYQTCTWIDDFSLNELRKDMMFYLWSDIPRRCNIGTLNLMIDARYINTTASAPNEKYLQVTVNLDNHSPIIHHCVATLMIELCNVPPKSNVRLEHILW